MQQWFKYANLNNEELVFKSHITKKEIKLMIKQSAIEKNIRLKKLRLDFDITYLCKSFKFSEKY